MKLWLLRPVENLPDERNPWIGEYDMYHGFVIRAETEARARQLATGKQHGPRKFPGDDERDYFAMGGDLHPDGPWADPNFTTCVELTGDGPEDWVMSDFKAG